MASTTNEFLNAIILQSNEAIITYWGDVQSTDDLTYADNGYLVLTNQRCIFIKKTGVFTITYHQDIVFFLDSLSEITVKQSAWLGNFLTISGKKFICKNPDNIHQTVMDTRSKLKSAFEGYNTQPTQSQQPSGVRMCLGCGSQIGLQYLVCPYCQKSVSGAGSQQGQSQVVLNVGQIGSSQTSVDNSVHDSVVQQRAAAPSSQSAPKTLKRCPYCGEELNFPKSPKFCPYCNEQLQC